MDLRELTPKSIASLAFATGVPKVVAMVIADALRHGRNVDVRVERDGQSFFLVMMTFAGESIIDETRLAISWTTIPEEARLGVLHVYVDQLCRAHGSWVLRMGRACPKRLLPGRVPVRHGIPRG